MVDLPSLDERYFRWLYSQVAATKNRDPAKSYWLLFETLYKHQFEHHVPNDHNRAADGRSLRLRFFEETGADQDIHWYEMECSVLEMLIALSERLFYQTDESHINWFWRMIENLELLRYTDEVWNDGRRIGVEKVIYELNKRTYDYSGQGGLFPLKDPTRDQRGVEIWYQMQAYLMQ